MSNPYMRDALVDEMEEDVRRRPGGRQPTTLPASTAYSQTPGRAVEAMVDEPDAVDTAPPGGGGGSTTAPPPPPTNPWDDPASSKYAPRIVERGGQTYLTEHGNERLLQPGEIAGGTQYRDDFWKQYPTGFQPGVGAQTNDAYAPPTQQSSGASLGASGATAGRYAGFDTQRAQDPSTSAKDAFLQAANASGSMPSTKEEAEAWFNQYVKQALIDAGYQVDWVDGDKAFVRTRENPGGEEIDFLQDAGGENPMLAWQSNMAGTTTGGGGAASTGGSAASAILGNENVMDDINAAIAKLMEQGMGIEEIQALIESGGMAGN